MIIGIEGLAGAGKTFFMTKLLYKEWKKGESIHANYHLFFDDENEGTEKWRTLSQIYHIRNGIITIDEASILFDNQNWMRLPQQFKDLISKHRHHMVDVMVAMQNYLDIDVKLRKNIHVLYTCEKIFRFPKNEKVKPLLQITSVQKQIRKKDRQINQIKFVPAWSIKRYLFISRLWTKKMYDTYNDMDLEQIVCKMIIKNNKPILKVYSREMIDRGRKRL